MCSVEAGNCSHKCMARDGRKRSVPPQLGQVSCKCPLAHEAQNVHSNEQMYARSESAGKAASQHSQFGRISNMVSPLSLMEHHPIVAVFFGISSVCHQAAQKIQAACKRPVRHFKPAQTYSAQPEMNLLSMNSSKPNTPPSRARPEAFTPPNAAPRARLLPFISTMPACN